jgi:hypothetical protein
MAKVNKYIILSYDNLGNFVGYLSAFSASGANQFAPQIHQAIPFDTQFDCIYSHGQEWEEGRGSKKGHYEHRIHEVEENTLFEQKILEVYQLPLSYDRDSQSIFDAKGKMISDIRGWGFLQYKKDAEKLQDTLGEMIAKAFNEKYSKK